MEGPETQKNGIFIHLMCNLKNLKFPKHHFSVNEILAKFNDMTYFFFTGERSVLYTKIGNISGNPVTLRIRCGSEFLKQIK